MSLLQSPSRLLFSSTPLSMTTAMLICILYDESVTTSESSLVFLDSSLYDHHHAHPYLIR